MKRERCDKRGREGAATGERRRQQAEALDAGAGGAFILQHVFLALLRKAR